MSAAISATPRTKVNAEPISWPSILTPFLIIAPTPEIACLAVSEITLTAPFRVSPSKPIPCFNASAMTGPIVFRKPRMPEPNFFSALPAPFTAPISALKGCVIASKTFLAPPANFLPLPTIPPKIPPKKSFALSTAFPIKPRRFLMVEPSISSGSSSLDKPPYCLASKTRM